ncbi:MAG: TlpA family protein disulfide reductase [Magnetococcales bacterium]|nr:TlpA family protein disulfide reductase [Magnetococcales bacterium]
MRLRLLLIVFMYFFVNLAVAGDEVGGLSTPLNTVDGKTLHLADFKGKVVLVNFWATWCPPCLDEIPDLIKLQKQYADRGLVVIGIDYMEKPDKKRLTGFIDEQGINYPIVFSDERTIQALARSLGGVYALPVTKLLNRDGKVAASHIGGLNFSEMRAMVEPLL